jgi:predicted secreted protein
MTRRVALAGLVRRAAEAVVFLLFLCVPSVAAERALIDFIGHSEDARYFAFEEFGIQDGSGFAYSTIYVVDLSTDSWVKGSPFRAMASETDYDAPLSRIREEAFDLASGTLSDLAIDTPAEVMALIGDGLPDAAGKDLTWADPLCCAPGATQDQLYTLSIETFEAESDFDCASLTGNPPLGYSLTLTVGEEVSELHRDGKRIPKSRGCAMDYRIYAVVQPLQHGGGAVAIISSYPFGFEGPDRRFLAVPINTP